MSVVLRSSFFALFQLVTTPVFSLIALLTFPLPPLTRYRMPWAARHLPTAANWGIR